jgi:hypothetical protein
MIGTKLRSSTRPYFILGPLLGLVFSSGACGSDGDGATPDDAAGGDDQASAGEAPAQGGSSAGKGSGGSNGGSANPTGGKSGDGAVGGTDPVGGTEAVGGGGAAAGMSGDGGVGGDSGSAECVPGATRECYDGPAGTKVNLPCKGGVATCDAQGAWGACAGQVLPESENCKDGIDNDCNGAADDSVDADGDGYTACEGDCCDVLADGCENPALINPSAIDARHVAQGGAVTYTDDDCSGTAGDSQFQCGAALALDDVSGVSAAAAIEVCRPATQDARSWGLLGARYTKANTTSIVPGKQVGIQTTFGANVEPRLGQRMLMLSTGRARTPDQDDACGSSSCTNAGVGSAPSGFPQRPDNCDPKLTIYDDIAFELTLRAPSNATGIRFSYAFYAFDEPKMCSPFLDQFVVLQSPAPAGAVNGNIAVDSSLQPVTALSSFQQGTAALEGTGFDTWATAGYPGGATPWLTTTSPVQGGTMITWRFIIWDTGDPAFDSSVLIDNFEWLTESGVTLGTQLAE